MPQASNHRGTFFAALSMAVQQDAPEAFEREDILMYLLFLREVCKKAQNSGRLSAEPDVQHDGRNDTECH